MNMKKIAGVVAGAALALGLSAPASAVVLTAGNLKITLNAYDSGTLGYGNTAGTKCTSAAACDAVAQNAPFAIGSEDTWGIFSVQSITNLTTGQDIFTVGEGGKYLTGVFGGIVDTAVSVNVDPIFGPTTSAGAVGGWLKMYETNANYTPAQGPSKRIGVDGYEGISDIGGALALSATFGTGVLGGNSEFTYLSTYNNNTISGGGQAYLDVTGGTWASEFDTNAQFDPNGNAHDLFLKVTFGQTGGSAGTGWTVDATGDVQGAIGGEVPEPASLALFGLGLAGLAALRRRRA
jgi:hypothetical protein